RKRWPAMRATFAKAFKSKTRAQWCRAFEGSDACFAPVLSWSEARRDPHTVFRKSFLEMAGVKQPAPAPRFSRTPGAVRRAPPERGEGGAKALTEWGFGETEIAKLKSLGLGFRNA
ncbi:MAG: CoA transferase, partial [Burkholderiales bacterium]